MKLLKIQIIQRWNVCKNYKLTPMKKTERYFKSKLKISKKKKKKKKKKKVGIIYNKKKIFMLDFNKRKNIRDLQLL